MPWTNFCCSCCGGGDDGDNDSDEDSDNDNDADGDNGIWENSVMAFLVCGRAVTAGRVATFGEFNTPTINIEGLINFL